MTLGIAIPTYSGHIHYLEGLLDLIQLSTVKPNQVSISCSSQKQEVNIKNNYDFEVILNVTEEYKNPAQNRNIAASKLNTDIISFIDGDDFPHTQRNEFIINSFKNHGVTCLVHNYYTSLVKNNMFLSSLYPNMDLQINCNNCIDYHHAQISILKHIFNNIKYDENEIFKYREDSLFTQNLIDTGHNLSLITNKLSQYNK